MLLRWLPLALVMLQVCMLCTPSLLTAANNNLHKLRSSSNGAVVW